MGRIIKWGILGCGGIANKFAADLKRVDDAILVAVGSRSEEKATIFAAKHGIEKSYGTYESLVADPDIDVIYIASPHSHHHEHTLLCLHHNKAVLCEKAFAMNHRQALEMIGLAREKKLFLMEALWTKFLPPYQKVMELLKAQAIGDVKNILISFGFVAAARNIARLTDPELGGGTILDIGVYTSFYILNILGRPDRIYATMTPSAEGVDEQCAVIFKYNNGKMAQFFTSFSAGLANEVDIAGPEGRIRIRNRFHDPQAIVELFRPGQEMETITVDREEGMGFQYEARHVVACLQDGLTESPVITHADTLLAMETLDRIREAAGITYVADVVSHP